VSVGRYLSRRFIASIIVLIGVSIVIFLLARLIPGDTARIAAGPRATPEMVELLRARLHLDESLPVPDSYFLKGLVTEGDLGMSIYTNRAVTIDIVEFFPATFELVLFSGLFMVLIGVPLGILSARHRDGLTDNIARVVALLGVVTPTFVWAIFLMLAFAYAIDLFPTITNLAGIDVEYHGYGRDLLSPSEIDVNRLVLSELDSLYGIGFLSRNNLEMPHHRVTSRTSVDNEEISRYSDGVRLWSLTDGEYLYREDEQTGEFVYRHVLSGEDLACEDPDHFRDAYDEILMNSNYQHLLAQESTTEETEILEGRLRDLGYVE